MHTCTHTHTHTHTHTYTHAHTRTHTHTHTPLVSRPVFIYRVDCNKSVFFCLFFTVTNFIFSLSHIIFMSVTYASMNCSARKQTEPIYHNLSLLIVLIWRAAALFAIVHAITSSLTSFMTEEGKCHRTESHRQNQKLMSHCMLVISSWVLNNTRNTIHYCYRYGKCTSLYLHYVSLLIVILILILVRLIGNENLLKMY